MAKQETQARASYQRPLTAKPRNHETTKEQMVFFAVSCFRDFRGFSIRRYSSLILTFRNLTKPAKPPASPAGGHWKVIGPASFHSASAGSVGVSVTSQIFVPFNQTRSRGPLNEI